MKPQQRKFIVEVKSARRRTMIRPSSIWGDTNLKALAREAETAAPHLFEPTADLDKLSLGTNAEGFAKEDTSIAAAAQSPEPAVQTEENVGTEEAVGSVTILPFVADLTSTVPPRKPKRQVPARGSRPVSKTTMADDEATREDVAALEEENRWLRGLLAKRIQQENIQLRKMLERFAPNPTA